MNQIKYKKRNFYLLLLTLFSKTEVYPSISPIGWDMTSHEIPKVKVPKVDHQIEEWRAIFSEHKEQALTVNDHCEGLRLKLDQVYSHVGSKLKSEPEKRDLLANFYTQDIKIYNSKQLNFQYFNAINLRLSFLIDPHLVSSLFTEYVFSNIDLRIDEEWKDIEKCKTFLKIFSSFQRENGRMLAFIYTKCGGLAYSRFVMSLATQDHIGLVSLPLDATHVPHGGIIQNPALFLLHDLEHWDNYLKEIDVLLSRPPEKHILGEYEEIYIKSHNLSHPQKRIVEGSLFYILHEIQCLYIRDNAEDPALALPVPSENLNSENTISTELKLRSAINEAYDATILTILLDPKTVLHNKFLSDFLNKFQITSQVNTFTIKTYGQPFGFYLACENTAEPDQPAFLLPFKFMYSAAKVDKASEFQPDFWVLTKAEVEKFVFTADAVRDGYRYNGINYTCNQLENIAKDIVDSINASPEVMRTIQEPDTDSIYERVVKDYVKLLEWIYDEIFPKNSKGQVSSEIIKSNIQRMYQDFYKISKKLLLENNT